MMGDVISTWNGPQCKILTFAVVAHEGFVALAADGGMAIEIQVDCCTRPSRTRAAIQFASPYDVVVAGKGDKTLWQRAAQDSLTRRQTWSSSMALSTARSDHLSRYG